MIETRKPGRPRKPEGEPTKEADKSHTQDSKEPERINRVGGRWVLTDNGWEEV